MLGGQSEGYIDYKPFETENIVKNLDTESVHEKVNLNN